MSITPQHLQFRAGVERILPSSFSPDKPSFVPTDREVRVEGGRIPRYVDNYLSQGNVRQDLMLEFSKPSISSLVTVPAVFRRYLMALRLKLSSQRNKTRDIRKRQAIGRALQVIEELDANMVAFMEAAASLQKA